MRLLQNQKVPCKTEKKAKGVEEQDQAGARAQRVQTVQTEVEEKGWQGPVRGAFNPPLGQSPVRIPTIKNKKPLGGGARVGGCVRQRVQLRGAG